MSTSYRVIDLACPYPDRPALDGGPGARERAAERRLNELAAQGYVLRGLADGLAVLELDERHPALAAAS